MTAFRPSNRMIAGVAILIFTAVLLGVGLHHIIEGGTCSSTGYTRYGPAPKCPSGTGLWTVFLLGGIFGIIGGCILADLAVLVVPVMFTAIGLGALTLLFSANASSGEQLFALIFGGSFLLGGLVGPAFTGIKRYRERT
jgi:hypothetical protein